MKNQKSSNVTNSRTASKKLRETKNSSYGFKPSNEKDTKNVKNCSNRTKKKEYN